MNISIQYVDGLELRIKELDSELRSHKVALDGLQAERNSLKKALVRQAGAAKQGMDAAKKTGAHMEAEARRLHAECNPEALDSERQANAKLTEELELLRAERDAIWETLIKVADMLGIDPEKARSVPGKPSDVYAAHLARLKAEWQAEVLDRAVDLHIDDADTQNKLLEMAQELRSKAEDAS